ncbi:hypothetical protein BO82DRAFT_133348 [Aspergillus uvarum CBS 121591]|uniref:Uncharacterized protein n=1 Tax=Aspergillus uvarum CBS 121591 TaxID=1448315 RepID=A0A319C640_9EURO|nr:hypothetical protein BO82DRAFT_133348 [Aspergillus uvarum CBS 121591]PYH79450.1 hypothetical protein BO82DRAFT_133348 [Aspergillus uvarum CBS 121591]
MQLSFLFRRPRDESGWPKTAGSQSDKSVRRGNSLRISAHDCSKQRQLEWEATQVQTNLLASPVGILFLGQNLRRWWSRMPDSARSIETEQAASLPLATDAPLSGSCTTLSDPFGCWDPLFWNLLGFFTLSLTLLLSLL